MAADQRAQPTTVRLAPLLWTVALGAAWPGLQVALFAARFGRVDGALLAESALFLPMGLVGGAALVWCWRRTRGRAGRIGAALGYLLASPVALAGSLLGGLLLHPLLGALLLGGLPLAGGAALGAAIGSAAGRSFSPSRAARGLR